MTEPTEPPEEAAPAATPDDTREPGAESADAGARGGVVAEEEAQGEAAPVDGEEPLGGGRASHG
ncbi:hypothetical protein G5C51_13330, partial [Streptomyces sp. A7024]